MKKLFYYTVYAIFISFQSLSAENLSLHTYKEIKVLKPFWQNEPVIGRWLSGGQGLIAIPKYMKDTSFPYKKRDYKKEVPFANGLTVVRLLGGWDYSKKRGELDGQKDADLVYVESHIWQYRWDLLKKRLDPYIDAGYTDLTLVLDNVPWDLPKKPKLDKMGQVNPPYSMKKWAEFIEAMCKTLVRIYGEKTVEHFRFRVGTECQSRIRFNGTPLEYVDLYKNTVKAVHTGLPNAKIAPFNFAGPKGQMEKANIDMRKFVVLLDQNKKDHRVNEMVDFLPVSTYYVVRKKHKKDIKKLLDARTVANRKYFNSLFETMGQVVPKEIHEFGILNNTLSGIHSDEPGVRGTAWRMYMIQNMMENNVSRLYHWGTFDRIGKEKYLLKGNGWLYSVLDHLAGGEAYSLPVVTEDAVHHKTLLVKKGKKIYLLTTIFPDERDAKFEKNITLSIPSELLPIGQLKTKKWTYLTSETSVIDVIHNDFLSKGLLTPNFLSDLNVVGRVNIMGGTKSRPYMFKNWDHYTKIVSDSLRLKPFNESIKEKNGFIQIDVMIKIPSVNIIEFIYN